MTDTNTTTNMMDDIRQSVANNLTGIVGDELLKILDEYKKLRVDYAEITIELSESQVNNTELKSELRDANSVITDQKQFARDKEQFARCIASHADDVFKFETEKENIVLKTRLSERDSFDSKITHFYETPFKNRILRESVMTPVKMGDHVQNVYDGATNTTKDVVVDGGEILQSSDNTIEEL